MGGRLLNNDDIAYEDLLDEIRRLRDIDAQSYQLTAQQSLGRNNLLRGGMKKGQVSVYMGTGKTFVPLGMSKTHYLPHLMRKQKLAEQTLAASNDTNNFPQWEFIGEFVIDTRNVDFDEEDYGIEVISSNAIPLQGNVRNELLYQESLHRVNVVSLLGLEHLDECEVDIGVFRYVFGVQHSPGVDVMFDLNDDTETKREWDNNSYELISRQQYDFGDEEYVTREEPEDDVHQLS